MQASPQIVQEPTNRQTKKGELSRLISAAVINQGFRSLLLADPKKALKLGFNGEVFFIDVEEQEIISSIQAGTLSEFAIQVADYQ